MRPLQKRPIGKCGPSLRPLHKRPIRKCGHSIQQLPKRLIVKCGPSIRPLSKSVDCGSSMGSPKRSISMWPPSEEITSKVGIVCDRTSQDTIGKYGPSLRQLPDWQVWDHWYSYDITSTTFKHKYWLIDWEESVFNHYWTIFATRESFG